MLGDRDSERHIIRKQLLKPFDLCPDVSTTVADMETTYTTQSSKHCDECANEILMMLSLNSEFIKIS